MSIEKTFERIADALEALVELAQNTDTTTTTTGAPDLGAPTTTPPANNGATKRRGAKAESTGTPATAGVPPLNGTPVPTPPAATAAPTLGPGPTAPPAASVTVPPVTVPPVTGAPTITKDDLTDQLREVVKLKGVEVAKAILAKFGADRVTAVDPANYVAVMEQLKAAVRG